jgi:RNA recognition motif-containing protein
MLIQSQCTKGLPGNHNYCFIDLESADEANRARRLLDGLSKWGGHIRVRPSHDTSGKLSLRRRLHVGNLPEFSDQLATKIEMQDFFGDFELESISELFRKVGSEISVPGHPCYCFVELKDEEQTDRAVEMLNRKLMWGAEVKIDYANASGRKAGSPEPNESGPGRNREPVRKRDHNAILAKSWR